MSRHHAPKHLADPADAAIAQGETASLTVNAQGPAPLYYQWRFNGVNLAGETNATLSVANFQRTNAGPYTVLVRNSYGAVLSAPAVLTFFPIHPEGAAFRIAALTASNSKTVDHNNLTSDDRGGIASSLDGIFITGDSATARFDLALTNGMALNRLYDGLVSNLRNGKVYVLASNDVPLVSQGSATLINALLELDGRTGLPTEKEIPLTQAIPVYTGNGQNGIFSGYDRVVVYNGTNAFQISLPSARATWALPASPLIVSRKAGLTGEWPRISEAASTLCMCATRPPSPGRVCRT